MDGIFLEVWSEYVAVPKGARYSYRNFPEVTLYDNNSLPVPPFNTTINRGEEVSGFTDAHKKQIRTLIAG